MNKKKKGKGKGIGKGKFFKKIMIGDHADL